MESIIFIAPPAAGKGTQAALISKQYNIPSISTGDLLRACQNEDTPLSNLIKERLSKGMLVDDDIVLELVKNRIVKSDCDNGYILDGFPRNVAQAIAYDEMLKTLNKKLSHVILLELDKEEAKKRIVGRLSCPNCKSIYNDMFENMKPKEKGICDKCQNSLVKRSDDSAEVYDERYDIYLKETMPLIEFYENKNILYRVDSSNKDVAFNSICNILGENND